MQNHAYREKSPFDKFLFLHLKTAERIRPLRCFLLFEKTVIDFSIENYYNKNIEKTAMTAEMRHKVYILNVTIYGLFSVAMILFG